MNVICAYCNRAAELVTAYSAQPTVSVPGEVMAAAEWLAVRDVCAVFSTSKVSTTDPIFPATLIRDWLRTISPADAVGGSS